MPRRRRVTRRSSCANRRGAVDHGHEPVNCEAAKLGITDAREVGGRNAGLEMRRAILIAGDLTLRTNLYGYFFSVTGLSANKDLLDYSLTKGGIEPAISRHSSQCRGSGSRLDTSQSFPTWTPLSCQAFFSDLVRR